MTTNHLPNRLAKEKSPYLLQHAHNPVNWYPWGEEAFDQAKAENKPIFLSVGYSTCHWCHVMERESFEDEEVAKLLNREYVAIKVDREERPDVDHVYMTVCQAMTGQGGWPLTVIMTPDKKPFYAGTYFPKRSKYGRYGLMDVLEGLAVKWREDRAAVVQTAERAVQQLSGFAVKKQADGGPTLEWLQAVMDRAFEAYHQSFDPDRGGFGRAPKFPSSHNLSFLLKYSQAYQEERALDMAVKTLEAMRSGGIYDQIGFGFSRYSTDERWLVPHFEKMLYDNALLAMTYTEAYQITGNELFARTAREIFAYVLRDMTDPEGGFYSAEDADSEGEEGRFYVWTPEELAVVLGQEDGELFAESYGIAVPGNFEGASIPNLIDIDWEAIAKRRGLSADELPRRLEASRAKLFEHRERRVHPHKDDKILTSWNGLMIMALAKGAKAFGEPAYAAAAEKAARFIRNRMIREDGRLLARFRDGEAAYPAYLDDYAFLAWGLIELFEATGAADYLEQAAGLAAEMLRLFADAEHGGFFFSGHDGEELFLRPKESYDGAMPAGNSAALLVLTKLARYLDREDLSEVADKLIAVFAAEVEGYPAGHSLFVAAVHGAMHPGKEIVIAGEPDDPEVRAMLIESRQRYAPDDLILPHPPGSAGEAIRRLCPLVRDKQALEGKATAYLCENFTCRAPITDSAVFRASLE